MACWLLATLCVFGCIGIISLIGMGLEWLKNHINEDTLIIVGVIVCVVGIWLVFYFTCVADKTGG